jgi:hypothetical protein
MKHQRLLALTFFILAPFFTSLAQTTNRPERLRNLNLDQAQQLLLDYFPTVYLNGLGIDAEEWEQSIRIDEKKKIIEYRRRPFIENNTKSEWYATIIIPLEAITAITEEHKGHTITIQTAESQIVSYNFDVLAAKSSSFVINMRDLGSVRNLAKQVYFLIKNFCEEDEK